MTETVTLPTTIRADEFWSVVFGSSFETFSWWRRVEYLTGDWETPGVVRLSIDSPDGPGAVTKDVDLAALVVAYTTAHEKARTLGAGRLNHEDLDACDGDAVLQFAVLGHLVYG